MDLRLNLNLTDSDISIYNYVFVNQQTGLYYDKENLRWYLVCRNMTHGY